MNKIYLSSDVLTKKTSLNHFLLIMRTAVILLFTCVFISVAETGRSQNAKVSLNKNNVNLKEVLNEIENQTDYLFIYNNQVNTDKRVSVNTDNTTVKEVLTDVLKDSDIGFMMEGNHIILSYIKEKLREKDEEVVETVKQQGKTITGTIVDAQGDPIIGANVIEKGTTNGTITDIDGNFTLEVDADAVLRISYIGYLEQEINTQGQNSFDIVLIEDTKTLDEVVVIGYGTQRKADLTGAVSMVTSDDLAISSNTSAASMLQGKLSGVHISNPGRPGSGTSFNVRGIGSFGSGADNSPLIVIDGVPVQGGMETINPNDIESVNLLKDASSAAIYGSRAANGVILVTTKEGKQGEGKLNVNIYTGTQSPTKKLKMLSPEQFVDATKEAISNQEIATGTVINTPYKNLIYNDVGHVDWVKEAFSSASITNINANFSGGSEKTRYYLSGEYLTQDGIGPDSGYDKFSARANIDSNVKKWLKVGNNMHVSKQKLFGDQGGHQSSLTYHPPFWDSVYNDDGSLAGPNEFGLSVGQKGNPLIGYKVNNTSTTWLRMLDNFYAEIEFVENLKLKFNAGYDLTYRNYKSFLPKYNISGSQRDRNQYTEYRDFNQMWLTEFILSYSNTIGKHSFNGLAAHSRQLDITNDNMHGNVKDFASDAYNMQVLSGGTNSVESSVSGSRSELAVASYFGRLGYNYDNRYLFNFNIRADGSSRFHKDERWGVFPSFSGAWNIHEENFINFNNISFLNSLKIRASWGKLGNQSVGSYYPTLAAINRKNVIFGSNNDTQKVHAGYVQDQIANRSLRWETTTITDIGFDIGLFDGRLSITYDFFNKMTDGILRGMILPQNIGLNPPVINFAKVQNRGSDIELTYRNKVQDLNYSLGFNASYVKNEIKELSEGIDEERGNLPWNGFTVNRVGESLNSFYGYQTDGLFTSQEELDSAPDQPNKRLGMYKYKDLNGDGKIDDEDLTILGNSIPKWNLGATINADWKGFDFSMVWMAVLGRDQHHPMQITQMSPPDRNIVLKRYDKRYQIGQPYEEGMLPALYWSTNMYNGSYDALFIDNSFARMKTISLGYTHNFKDISARLFVTGENLITITKDGFMGIDPENGSALGHYMTWGDGFPNPKIYMIGLNINF